MKVALMILSSSSSSSDEEESKYFSNSLGRNVPKIMHFVEDVVHKFDNNELDTLNHTPNDKRMVCTIYSKKTYNPPVKIPEWQMYQDSRPADNDPFCAEGYNLHYSHYNRLGTYENDWTTTTQEALEQIHSKKSITNPNKTTMNLFTHVSRTCDDVPAICSSADGQDYRTTMQHSYQPPYPYMLQRLSMPEIPFYLNRRIKPHVQCKFQDDSYKWSVKKLQAIKKGRHVSFDPCTCLFTDGRSGDVEAFTCVDLPE